jgi:Zn-dependent protease
MSTDVVVLGLLWYVGFLLSTTCHEAAHAFAAKLGGDLTAFHGGQVSLDPIPHLRREPFGMILFPILTYATSGWMMGWASAPYDPEWSMRHPHRAAWMSLAGPGANFALAILAAIVIHIGIAASVFSQPDSANFTHMVQAATSGGAAAGAATLVSILFSLNVLLGIFNLLPLPPLDGFGAVGLLMSEERARRFEGMAHRMRGYSFIGLLIAWQVFGRLYDPLFGLSLHALYPLTSYSG